MLSSNRDISLTRDCPRKHRLCVLLIAEAYGHPGCAGHRLTDVGSVDQVSEVLHPQRGGPLPHSEAQGVHHIGLPWSDLKSSAYLSLTLLNG